MFYSLFDSQEVQILKALVLGEEERGQSQYQVMCFVTKFVKSDFISSDAMAKLRQVSSAFLYVLNLITDVTAIHVHVCVKISLMWSKNENTNNLSGLELNRRPNSHCSYKDALFVHVLQMDVHLLVAIQWPIDWRFSAFFCFFFSD